MCQITIVAYVTEVFAKYRNYYELYTLRQYNISMSGKYKVLRYVFIK